MCVNLQHLLFDRQLRIESILRRLLRRNEPRGQDPVAVQGPRKRVVVPLSVIVCVCMCVCARAGGGGLYTARVFGLWGSRMCVPAVQGCAAVAQRKRGL